MNCGRSSSVEWKLPKLQRRVRFPSPAPLPPGRAPGGFVIAVRDAREQRRYGAPAAHEGTPHTQTDATLYSGGNARHVDPTRRRQVVGRLRGVLPPLPTWRAPRHLQDLGAAPVGAKILAQHGPSSGLSAKKLAQHGPSSSLSAKKFAQHGPSSGLSAKKFAQQAQKRRIWGVLSAQGELFRAFAMTQGRGANFFAPK